MRARSVMMLLLSVSLVAGACDRRESGLGGAAGVSPTPPAEVSPTGRTEVGPCPWTEGGSEGRSRSATSGLKSALRRLAPNAAVAIVRTEAGIERGANGESAPGRAATPRDRFDIGSISKTFVATVVLQLAGEGRLSLENTLGGPPLP